jgi:hypothetical protein
MPGRRQLVVTKAGAFGHEGTLLALLPRPVPPPPERNA